MISQRPAVHIRSYGRPRGWELQQNSLGGLSWEPAGNTCVIDRHVELPVETVQVPEFTDAEYAACLQQDGWSLEETRYLMDLCKKYERRFIIVTDRYDPSHNRTLTDLKERFYNVESRLKASRGRTDIFRYDAEWDRKRRLQLESFHARPTAEQQEEVFIMDEVERVLEVLPEIVREREAVMMMYHSGMERITTEGPLPTLLDVANGIAHQVIPAVAVTRRKSVTSTGQKSAPRQRDRKKSITSTTTSGTASRQPGSSSTDSLRQTTSVSSVGPGRKPKPTSNPTHLSSTCLQPIRVGLCRHVDRMMADYGVPSRPTYATPAVLERYDELRALLARLADAKKALESIPPS